ncbi:hypothetical protein BDZ45DRAFT_222682 [Acephala macrosclerotiorum]|nr:hypothetical protein BDZ45DRAFT_222682 [Acephala macrosclerotiorum]
METHNALLMGDIIIVRDVPIGTIIGYDAKSIMVAQKNVFEGIKEVPPGAHFVWGGSSAGSLRTGFWLISSVKGSTEHGQRIVKKWDAHHEMLVDESSAAEVYIQKMGISEIVNKLHPYSAAPAAPSGGSEILAEFPGIWQDLTSSIKGNMLSKITGTDVWNSWHVSSTHDYKLDRGEKPTTAYGKDEVLSFVFPKDLRTFSRQVTGRQRTEQAMDTTAHILAVIRDKCTYEDSDEIVGEIQFCYVTGMLLGNVACMEHYAHVVKMVFKAIQLPLAGPIFFMKFIKAVQAQFMYDNVGIDGSIFDHDSNFEKDLRLILISFKSRFNELILKQKALDDEQKAVCKAFDEFENWLWKFRGGWDLRGDYVRSGKIQLEDGEYVDIETTDFEAEDERGEFAPAVVELDEDGREKDLIRF